MGSMGLDAKQRYGYNVIFSTKIIAQKLKTPERGFLI
jgi:hypothetical protein